MSGNSKTMIKWILNFYLIKKDMIFLDCNCKTNCIDMIVMCLQNIIESFSEIFLMFSSVKNYLFWILMTYLQYFYLSINPQC
jgi:hypothetical protein